MTAPEGRFTREQLEASILGDVPDLTGHDVAEASHIDPDVMRLFWQALGFADAGDQAAFTAGDVAALSIVSELLESDLVDTDDLVRMTRALGHTVARLADWEVATLVGRVEELEQGADATGSRLGSALRMHETIGSGFEQLLLYAWRRHLAAAVSRVEALGANDVDLHTAELTVGFADLVGFSAYSNEHTQAEIGEVVEAFESQASDAVTLHRGRVIKTLGDSVLYVAESAEAAYDIAAEIVREIGKDAVLPDVRVGLATGPVVLRLGDVYGPAVNLAARMVTVARRNRVIADQRTAELLPPESFSRKPLPLRPIHGFGEIEPVAVRRKSI